ncbi:PKD-like family lipoprotein [Paracnuella aquatica]|uniref:PKD-like family lipoprotein n=1 Tax=Paracnuella aquatica TaxID=2268757 RepID=UPI000DEF8C34|nr:PKD-like family lipoprotein [Paracnuella aquatica]RPD47299.1 hypothetical protein DRJ53_12395 [Paracnuella aquatica]
MNKQTFIKIFCFTLLVSGLLVSCYKDKGNYEYNMPEAPKVTTLDTVYSVFVGDSLIVDPGVTTSKGSAHLRYDWKIAIPEKLSHDSYSGPQLRTIFGLGPKRYFARLSITDTITGMKYFHDFAIDGKTAFSKGMVVLSEEGETGQLTFIRPDGTVQARLYEAMHGESLPKGPLQLVPVAQAYNPSVINSYWVFSSTGDNPGVQLDANTMQRKQYIKENFFEPPASVKIGGMQSNFFGVITGVANGKLYAGTTSTWDQNPLYGKFGLSTPGDYELSDKFIFNFSMATFSGYYIGFDKIKKGFLRFNLFGSPMYFGVDYDVMGNAFDPKNTGMELLHLVQINGNDVYAFMKAPDGAVYEHKFTVNFNGPFQFTPIHRRLFAQQNLMQEGTKLVATNTGVFYLANGNTIHRYNPLNGELVALGADLGGKAVSMIKLMDNDNTLAVGVEGAVYLLNVGTGQNGSVTRKIEGIPGRPVDLAVR